MKVWILSKGGGRWSTPNPNLFKFIFGKGKILFLGVRTLGIGLLGGPLYITNIYSTEIVNLKRMITKLCYFGVQTLGGGEGGGGVKKSLDRIHTFIFFLKDDFP